MLRFRHLLEQHDLCGMMLDAVNIHLESKNIKIQTGTIVDATLVHAPSSTKNSTGERDPEMKQTKKGNQWYFGLKAHVGVDAKTGTVHTLVTTSASVRAKVERVFRIVKRIFGFDKLRYRGLAKNHHRLCTNFALANLYLHRKQLAVLG